MVVFTEGARQRCGRRWRWAGGSGHYVRGRENCRSSPECSAGGVCLDESVEIVWIGVFYTDFLSI